MNMWRCACFVAGVLALFAPCANSAAQEQITAESLTDAHVRGAIAAIVEELYSRKHPERHWEPAHPPPGESTRQGGGYTALTVLALVSAGQSYQDPRLTDAVEYLASFPMQGTYAVTMRSSVWARLPEKFHVNLTSDAQWLLDGFSAEAGGWDYVQNPRTKREDNSIRQFGALALWDAARRDLKIDKTYWQQVEKAFLDLQLEDGGWNYNGRGPATGSMTSAGLATLFITQDLLHAEESIPLRSDKTSQHEDAIARGMAWMDEHFSPAENPGKNTYFYYYLFGVERVGLASGYKTFGGRDWFRLGAAEIIHRLCSWDESSQRFEVHTKTAGRRGTIHTDHLAFGLMFLSRGRVPVAVNKLQFDGAWNNRPRDVANLTAWITQTTETDLSWQIVDIQSPPHTWLDAPVLYVASNRALPWMESLDINVFDHVKKQRLRLNDIATGKGESGEDNSPVAIAELDQLKQYIDSGGLVFAVNEGVAKNFARSVEEAGSLMYPQYEWRTLPDDHWAYSIHIPIDRRRPALRGLSNGVRELIIVSLTGDLAATYQISDERKESHFQTASNIYLYSSELNRPHARLAVHSPAVRVQTTAQNENSGDDHITLVRASYAGNWNPEPAALLHLTTLLAKKQDMAVRVADHPLAHIDDMDSHPILVYVCGVAAHSFTIDEVDAVKSFVNSGGVILFETVGGVGDFAQSAEQAASEWLSLPAESLLRNDIITGDKTGNGFDLSRVEYRPYSFEKIGTRETVPRLKGIPIDGQPRVLFSSEDLSHALLDQPCWGISGYSNDSSRKLLTNIVLYATRMSRGIKVPVPD